MMLEERETVGENLAKEPALANGIDVDSIRSLRRIKLADTAERSLHWLIPAAALAYLVFRILPLLSAGAPRSSG
jgi:hypothetical protein